VELGYARVSTAKQDLDRQIEALLETGIARDRIYVDKKSGSTVDRPGLRAVLKYSREGDVIVVHTLDRLGRTVRDTLNLIHELSERRVGVRNLADPIRIDSTNPEDPMAQLAVVLLALFAQMERTYTLERAAHARAVATAKGRRVGRPVLVDAPGGDQPTPALRTALKGWLGFIDAAILDWIDNGGLDRAQLRDMTCSSRHSRISHRRPASRPRHHCPASLTPLNRPSTPRASAAPSSLSLGARVPLRSSRAGLARSHRGRRRSRAQQDDRPLRSPSRAARLIGKVGCRASERDCAPSKAQGRSTRLQSPSARPVIR